MPEPRDAALILHYPCFDGLVSAAVAWDVLETERGWSPSRLQFVNYDLQSTWLDTSLPQDSAVVDFLFHPDAAFWADHHGTSFLTDASHLQFEDLRGTRPLLYDRNSPSCAMLIWKHYAERSSDQNRYGEMAYWANKIDSATYDTVDEAVFGTSPAMQINSTFAIDRSTDYGTFLLQAMRGMTLADIASLPEVGSKVALARDQIERGLRDVEHSIHLEHEDIAVFAGKPSPGAVINRYSPYYFYPSARYSVSLIMNDRDAKITAMRNPWLDFQSVDLGNIFRKHGGGGHTRVASALIDTNPAVTGPAILHNIVEEICAADRRATNPAIATA
ncbi:MAG: hypothetical protein JO036_06155 [Candidatus Eremiobacteraeota bacterium]|nr:hypothetical protein [Candidatus Eremiobacteraeota bacterium]